MRYLNKVSFINSAAVKYAELDLNGNVHFIGTQGVGKSTLLRAILFFYNANSLKLGVPSGPTNKSFAEWYFPYQNSYIVYEVLRETGAYSLLAFKAQNRVCFRFIDAPYRQELFIGTDGRVHESWDKIRSQLDADKIFYSRQIKSYEEYRDIIYGNEQGKKEFQRYSLLESRQYLNIPRTIQNVFLNSKLDAEFIKQTIIDSMGEETVEIDLQLYAHHLHDFESQLNDIRQFRQPAVQHQGQKAAQLYVVINHLQREQKNLAAQLGSALAALEEQEPLVQASLATDEQSRQALLAKIATEGAVFKRRNDKYVVELTILAEKLKTGRTKAAHYANLNITAIMERVAKRTDLAFKQDNLVAEKNLLSGQFQELTQKYTALLAELDNQRQGYCNGKEQEQLIVKETFFVQRDEIKGQYEILLEEIRQQHQGEVAAARGHCQELIAAGYELKHRLAMVRQQQFYAADISQLQQELDGLELRLQQAEVQQETNIVRLEELQRRGELEEQALQESHQYKVGRLRQKIAELEPQIKVLADKLASGQGTLYSWLMQHRPGWEQDIGKVCDERLLFDQTLQPQKTAAGEASFYGIKLDLSQWDKKVKTLADYQHEQTLLMQEIESKEVEISTLEQELVDQLQKVQQRLHPQSRQLRHENRELIYQIEQHPQQYEKVQLHIQQWEEKGTLERQQQTGELQSKLEKTTSAELEAQEKLVQLEGQLKRQLQTKLRQQDKIIAELEQVRYQQLTALTVDIAANQQVYERRKAAVTADKNLDLKSRGADTDRLDSIEEELIRIRVELEFIEANRDLVAEYRRDKEDFLDRIKEFKNQHQLLEREQQQNELEFEQRRRKLQHQLSTLEGAIAGQRQALEEVNADREAFSRFKLSEVFAQVEGYLDSVAEVTSAARNCREIIEAIMDNYYAGIKRQNNLQEVVDKFLGHFSADNIFKFAIRFSSVEAYLDFSQDLTEFIEEDKIDEFERRVTERFAEIVTGLGKETTELVSRAGDIQKVINKINRDFTAKNFVGAIDSIELKLDESANRIFVILKQIKAFNDKHSLDFGTPDLFSTANHELNNQQAISLLRMLLQEVDSARGTTITLADSFELKFRIIENKNDTGWVEKLSHVGSDGTDVLVKAMVNIMLLNVFKEGASRRFSDFRLHCMMDEIGKLHPSNIRGILKFANDRNIMLINGSPTENNALNYKHVFKVAKDAQRVTKVTRILTNNRPL